MVSYVKKIMAAFVLLSLVAACSGDSSVVQPTSSDVSMLVSSESDSDSDSEERFGPWSAPVNLGAPNSSAIDLAAEISPDGLTLYFASNRAGGAGANDIYVTTRECTDAGDARCAWTTPVNLQQLNSPVGDAGPLLSADGHRLYLTSQRPGGFGANDIYVSYRDDVTEQLAWGPPINIGSPINSAESELGPSLWKKELYFFRAPPVVLSSPGDLYVSAIRHGEFQLPQLVLELRVVQDPSQPDPYHDSKPAVRFDGRELFFESNRPDGSVGLADIWQSTRRSWRKPWGAPTNMGTPINSVGNERRPSLSADGTMLFYDSDRPGGAGGPDLYVVTRKRLTTD